MEHNISKQTALDRVIWLETARIIRHCWDCWVHYKWRSTTLTPIRSSQKTTNYLKLQLSIMSKYIFPCLHTPTLLKPLWLINLTIMLTHRVHEKLVHKMITGQQLNDFNCFMVGANSWPIKFILRTNSLCSICVSSLVLKVQFPFWDIIKIPDCTLLNKFCSYSCWKCRH